MGTILGILALIAAIVAVYYQKRQYEHQANTQRAGDDFPWWGVVLLGLGAIFCFLSFDFFEEWYLCPNLNPLLECANYYTLLDALMRLLFLLGAIGLSVATVYWFFRKL